jgi:hypothetical protein
MDAPTRADVQWTPPLRDPLAAHSFFSAQALQFPGECNGAEMRIAKPCERRMERAQQHLSDLGEPDLRRADAGFAAIRVLYTHGYEARPVNLIRVSKTGSGIVLVAKVLESREPEGQGRLMWLRARTLAQGDWNSITARVNEASLWSAPTINVSKSAEWGCGAHPLCYTVELVEGPKQHIVDECPCDSRRAWRVAELLTDFARCD